MKITISQLDELIDMMRENPQMEIAHLSVNNKQQLVYDSKHTVGERHALWRITPKQQSEQRDAKRLNNWRVGVVMNRMVNTKQYNDLRLRDFGTDSHRAERLFDKLGDVTPSMRAASTICQDIREKVLPVFETAPYRKIAKETVVPYYKDKIGRGLHMGRTLWANDSCLGRPSDVAPMTKQFSVGSLVSMVSIVEETDSPAAYENMENTMLSAVMKATKEVHHLRLLKDLSPKASAAIPYYRHARGEYVDGAQIDAERVAADDWVRYQESAKTVATIRFGRKKHD